MPPPQKRRKRGWLVAAAIAVVLVTYVAVVVVENRLLMPQASVTTPAVVPGLPNALGSSVTLTSWNLGYAGLGEESDFVADGGHSLFPPSGAIVQKNLDGIVATLGGLDQDVLMLQEVSRNSPLSWWKPVYDTIAGHYGDRVLAYRPDVATWGIPWPLAIDHGTVLAARVNPTSVEVVPLPSEPTLMMGFLKRRYALQVLRVPLADGPGEWVIANLHLSAFDDAGQTRKAQLDAVLGIAQAEYAKGNHVILGGDWNMVLHDPGLPSTSDKKFLFWIVDFPRDLLPAGWSIATDETHPTVRTLYKSYVKGENYVTSIDGFVVSPNVAVEAISTHDTGFAFSDHMPVTGRFTAR